MTIRKLAAIAFIFLGASAAWALLGSSLVARTGQFDERLERDVQLLWGAPHRQVAAYAFIPREDIEVEFVEHKESDGKTVRRKVNKKVIRRRDVPLLSTRASADLNLEHRQKGLLWYATYTVFFKASYTFRNPDSEPRELHIHFPLPAPNALFDDFVFQVNGVPVNPSGDVSTELSTLINVQADAPAIVDVRYRSRGLDTWTYAFASTGAAQVRDFHLTMQTNFSDVDFPAGAVSPNDTVQTPEGARLTWEFINLISGQMIGMDLPEKLNPGPFAARVTFFAPVSLLFFLAVMVIVGATKGPSFHPMHYWFIACAFFSFHLLLAYLVDHVAVHVAFATAAAVSLALVVSYLRVVTGLHRAWKWAACAQAVFLVLFSYAFFAEGFTGLAITVGAILTLFVLMQITARVSWDDVFATEHGNARHA